MFNMFIYFVIAWCCLFTSNTRALTIHDKNIQIRPTFLEQAHVVNTHTSSEFSSLFKGSEASHLEEKENAALNDKSLGAVGESKKTKNGFEFSSLFQADNNIHKLGLVSDAPTSHPTLHPVNDNNILSFKAVVQVDKVDGEVFTQESFDTVQETLETLWNAKSEQFGPGEVISFARKLLDEEPTEESRRRLSKAPYNTTFVVGFPVWFALKDYPIMQGNGSKLFTYLSSLMNDKVVSGEFAQVLIDIAQANTAQQLIQAFVPIIHYFDFYVYAESKAPTMYPSSMPSSSPTTAPTPLPSPHPTPAPTFAPTELPSGIPSSRPSLAPTKNYANTFLQFSVFFGVNNVTSQTLSLGGEQSLLETITDVTDVPADDMVYKGITNEIPSGGNVPGRRQLSSSWDMVIEVQLTIPLDDYPQFRGHPDEIFDFLKALFLSSVYDQSSPTDLPLFTEHLRKNSLLWGKEMFWAEVVKVDFSNWILIKDYKKSTPEPTSQPTGRPTSSPTISDAPDSLVFNAYWGFDQTTTTTLSLAGQSSLLETMIDVMDVSLNNLEYIGVTDTVRRRKLTETHQMVVQTKIAVHLADYPELQGNATKIYLFLTKLLIDSVYEADRPFQQLIRSKAVKNGAVEIENVVVFEVKFDPFQLQRHTKSPTVAPTLAPNSAPNASPTFAPTSNNNNGGNSDSSDAPTLHPTAAPNGGGGGGNTPTLAPTSNNGGGDSTPTLSPTASSSSSGTSESTSQGTNSEGSVAPTASPTIAPTFAVTSNAVLQYKAVFLIQNLTSTSFSVPEQNALLQSIAENQNVALSNVEYLGIRQVVNGRRLAAFDSLRVATRLTYSLRDHPEYVNASLLYLDSTATLRNGVKSQSFTKLFRLNADDNGATEALNGAVISVDFEDASTTTPVINSNGNGQINYSSADLAAIVSSSIVGFGMILFMIYVGYARCYAKQSKSTETYEEDQSQSHSQDDSMDFHTIYDGNNEWTDDVMIFINIQEDENASASSTISSRVMMPQTIVSSDGTFESRM